MVPLHRFRRSFPAVNHFAKDPQKVAFSNNQLDSFLAQIRNFCVWNTLIILGPWVIYSRMMMANNRTPPAGQIKEKNSPEIWKHRTATSLTLVKRRNNNLNRNHNTQWSGGISIENMNQNKCLIALESKNSHKFKIITSQWSLKQNLTHNILHWIFSAHLIMLYLRYVIGIHLDFNKIPVLTVEDAPGHYGYRKKNRS